MSFFTVTHKSQKQGSRARLGVIQTAHGQVHTPAFVPVATKGTLKGLTAEQAADLGLNISFVNTYHLVTHPGAAVVAQFGDIHRYSNLNYTLLSDSGGFQVFSLAQNSKRRVDMRGEEAAPLVKITEDGVCFKSVYNGEEFNFTPEASMQYQMQIGADINMAFDECTYYPATHEYALKSLERTNRWLERCINYRKSNKRTDYEQFLYGIIQGATFEDLRIASAKHIAAQDVQGVAIGGVSVGETKPQMREQVAWVAPYLPSDKPVHLLGVGHIDDILELVHHGIDTFDCVEPTRLARVGVLLKINIDQGEIRWDKIDILDTKYKQDPQTLQIGKYVYAYSYLHHLFKQKELLGYTLATINNLQVMNSLMAEVRRQIGEDLI